MPEVSIIMPNYNGAAFISEAVESVLAQTYQDWELIICDDYSTDDSPKIIEKYTARDPRIRSIRNTADKGVAMARNQAVALAKGAYVTFLDSDNLWYPKMLQVLMEYVHANGIEVACTAYDIITEQGHTICSVARAVIHHLYQYAGKGHRIPMETAIIKRALLPEVPFFPIPHEDFAMWLRVLKQGYIARGILERLACYRLRQHSLSSRKLQSIRIVWNLMRDREKLPLPQRIYYFLCYAATMLKKYGRILPEVLRLR